MLIEINHIRFKDTVHFSLLDDVEAVCTSFLKPSDVDNLQFESP